MSVTIPVAVRYHSTVRTVLVLSYMAGIVGLQSPSLAVYFRPLSPVILFFSLLVLLLYHTDWQPAFYVYLILTLVTGYFVEVLGVHTGFVFGHYAYGEGLGPSVWSVPPIIAVNWLLLTYGCGSVCSHLTIPVWLKVLAAATLMVVLDLFIEPVAVQLDFWTWFNKPVPLQNYLGWWLISIVLFTIWYALPFDKENRLAKWLVILQFVFFLSQSLFMFL
ncbi:carotenoid biosynthesis protein [Spirosoma agri]|uniref:Carotenoid biosynthesis protein n=1 Tax=Spirosoma agri TaxID=1987381 RepID=A0A6M0IJY6_9BACT|nr:carotenoid biosynthesis protein [Spirosoma agri]NEU68598.1 carotenoid biosynthesis protein [Spirosoma agri]